MADISAKDGSQVGCLSNAQMMGICLDGLLYMRDGGFNAG